MFCRGKIGFENIYNDEDDDYFDDVDDNDDDDNGNKNIEKTTLTKPQKQTVLNNLFNLLDYFSICLMFCNYLHILLKLLPVGGGGVDQ